MGNSTPNLVSYSTYSKWFAEFIRPFGSALSSYGCSSPFTFRITKVRYIGGPGITGRFLSMVFHSESTATLTRSLAYPVGNPLDGARRLVVGKNRDQSRTLYSSAKL